MCEAGQRAYCAQILRFRRALNLTSVDTVDGLMARFIRPSLALAQWVPEGARFIDIGSGMGIPGVPLLIARDDLSAVLVDRRLKRAEFLRHLVRSMGLSARVVCADVARVALDEPMDVVVARAVADPAALLNLAAPLLRRDGLALLPTGSTTRAPELPGWCALPESKLQFGEELSQRVLRFRRL